MKKFLLIIIIFFTYTHITSAADVYIDAPDNISNEGLFSVAINLNTGGSSINSVDISISYPKDILKFSGYKEDGVIKKIWLTTPKDIDGLIHFSGIIPGGVDGVYDPDRSGLQSIPIIVLLFSPKSNGAGMFTIARSEILQNDGLGTRLPHLVKGSPITISLAQTSALGSINNNGDKQPPEAFTIEYIPSGFFSKTPGMVMFFTTDDLSGVEKYQIKKMGDLWKDVVSPVPTPRGILTRDVVIRAVDFNGNIRESSVKIPGVLSVPQLFSIIIFGITCYFLFFVVKRKR